MSIMVYFNTAEYLLLLHGRSGARKLSASLTDRPWLNLVICPIARRWGKPARQPRGLIAIRRNESRKVETPEDRGSRTKTLYCVFKGSWKSLALKRHSLSGCWV
jgi:hypothetical protein